MLRHAIRHEQHAKYIVRKTNYKRVLTKGLTQLQLNTTINLLI